MHAKKIGIFFSCLHCSAAIATMLYIAHSRAPQAPMLWGIFAIIDFPISLLFLFAPEYGEWVGSFGDSFLAHIFYLPYIIHIFLGTIWWYFLPRLFLKRKLGGVWGRRLNSTLKPCTPTNAPHMPKEK